MTNLGHLAEKVITESDSKYRDAEYHESVKSPPSLVIQLPGGFMDVDGSVLDTVTVRELNGFDEEVIARVVSRNDASFADVMHAVLSQCTVKIGDKNSDPELLEFLYMGDWDAILLGIRIVSFGDSLNWKSNCPHCSKLQTFNVDLTNDVPTRKLTEREFSFDGKRDTYEVHYPLADVTMKVMDLGSNPTSSAITTETLYGCITSINGVPVRSRDQIRAMPSSDREQIIARVTEKMPAVLLGEVKKTCSYCEGEVNVPISLAALFQGRIPRSQ